ncbi:Type 4 prepilin-like proteins leader peptide-processing enzyme [Apilactobacillus kunkeei]|nr:Type 4 prepilin-like proteins leader peptide-processing enzyme [Apilactobacillus kunkeei]CAI2627285.1 Type 4 prepilin-like proteins leader peptide-processing enzyme [Apilactobacillus kunkeei]CAI2802804.1 Type 4 prepilin-like proteins leader peptide-processing enzyme [Apilactobacillus kunkeei]
MFLFILFILGSSFGSFLTALFYRIEHHESLLGFSHCDVCKHQLEVIDLIPIFSYLFNHGRCRYCHKTYSSFTFVNELFLGTVFPLLFIETKSMLSLLIIVYLFYLSLEDMHQQMVSNIILYSLLLIVFIFSLPFSRLIVLMPIYFFFYLLNYNYHFIGEADIDLFAILFLLIGNNILLVIFISSLLALVAYPFFKQLNGKIPFIPFIYISYLMFLCIKK